MPIVIDATYEDGVLKPAAPLPLEEHEQVRVTVEPAVSPATLETEKSPILAAYGIIGWTGDAASLEHLALSHEFDLEEA